MAQVTTYPLPCRYPLPLAPAPSTRAMSRATEGFSASTATLPDSAATIVLFQSGIICAEAVLWGSQSWLQPAFQPAFAEYEGCAAEPPERRLQAGLPAPHLFSSRETPPCASDSGTDDRVLSPVTRQA